MKNGRPTEAPRQRSSQTEGLSLGGTEFTHEDESPIGKLMNARQSIASWTINWRFKGQRDTSRAYA